MKQLLLLFLAASLLTAAAGRANAQVQRQNDNLTIFFTSDVQGKVTSCGCPILDLGGVTHREAFLDTLRSTGWKFLSLDAGGIFPFGTLDARERIGVEHLAQAMALMDFDGIALGDNDLAQGPDEVAHLLELLEQPVIASNYSFPDTARFPSVASRIVQVREPVVGVVAFLDPKLVTEKHDWLEVEPWDRQHDLVKELRGQVDVLVAMAAVADSARLVTLSEIYPEVDLIIGSHRGELPANLIRTGDTYAIGGGLEGKYLGRVEVSFDEAGAVADIQSTFLGVIKEWGRRHNIDRIVNDYHRKVRTLLMNGG